ncbi:MAG: IS21 family transposase [Dehalococcoidia bacterium]|nr:IS21 family transposase [Dehalococcoidia bacterium]
MAYKEVSRVEITEVIRQWQMGRGIREITRSTGLSRNTIRKYILNAQSCGLGRDGPPPTDIQLVTLLQANHTGPHEVTIPTDKVLEPWAEQIEEWIKRDRLKLTRIQELLAQNQCTVAYTCLRRYVTRKGWFGKSSQTTVRMADTEPGQMAEVDFGRLGMIYDPTTGRKRVAWGMLTVLNHSRHSFLWPLFSQQLGEVIEGLETTWAFFGGIPRQLILDNFPAAVVGPDPLNPRMTRGFLEYAQHRGFIADPARPSHPKDKPKVEKGISYVRERFFKGGQFDGLPDMRHQAKHWCLETAGQRIHGTTRRLPLVVFREEERACLLPYDGEPYDVPDWHKAMVHRDHHISYRYALYSAPYSTCPPGTKLEVRGDRKLVRLYRQGQLVKVHPRQPAGGRATDPEDYPKELTPYTLRSPNYLRRKSAELGDSVGDFADKLLGGATPWAKMRQAYKLLRLGEKYTPSRLDKACERALAVDLIDVRRLERILVEALEHETLPELISSTPPPGRFARPGSVFAIGGNNGSQHAETLKDEGGLQ